MCLMDESTDDTHVPFMACLRNRVIFSDLIVWRLSLTHDKVVDGVVADGYFDVNGNPITVKLKTISGTFVEVPWVAIQTIHICADLRKKETHGERTKNGPD